MLPEPPTRLVRPVPPPGAHHIPPPGLHGGDGARVAAALGVPVSEVLDLSASLNPVAPPVAALVSKYLDEIHRYPDPTRATAVLADAIGFAPDRVVLTNGGAEAIALVAGELGRGWVEEPDFALYRRHLLLLDRSGPRFASNPRNPTGKLAGSDERAEVWDEAFYPLATGRWTRGDAKEGCWVVGSLTKIFACPGLRAGYVICPDNVAAARIRARQPQWSVNALVCAALGEMLDAIDLGVTQRRVARLRRELVAVLGRNGLKPAESDANFVLIAGVADLRDRLAAFGVVVRDCASFGMPGCVRVAVPDEAGLERLAGTLERCL